MSELNLDFGVLVDDLLNEPSAGATHLKPLPLAPKKVKTSLDVEVTGFPV